MRAVRLVIAASLALVAVAPPASARVERVQRNPSGLAFDKPVALESYSPVRDAMSTYYSGGQPRKHEWSGEPVIQVDDKGVVYIAGTCCVVAASPVWRSDDGRRFTEMESPGRLREWGIGAEGDLAVDDDGNVYFVDTYIPGLLMSKWSDHGRTWEYTQPPAGVIPGVDDRPWLAWSEKALYLYINHVSHTQIYSSTDGGKTWSSEGPLSWDGSITGQPFFPGHIAAHRKTGTLWVSGVNQDGNGKPVLGTAVSTDGGATYRESIVTRPQRKGGFSPIFTGATAVDEAGNGYVTWSTFDDEGCDVYLAASTDEGRSWGEPVRLSDGRGCATFPWITADGPGKVAVAWYQTPVVGGPQPALLTALTAGTTVYGGIEIPDAAPQDELPDNAEWFLHAAAVTRADTARPKVDETRVPTKTPVALGPLGRQLWDFLQLDIGPDGRIHITYASKFKDPAPQTYYVRSSAGPRLN